MLTDHIHRCRVTDVQDISSHCVRKYMDSVLSIHG